MSSNPNADSTAAPFGVSYFGVLEYEDSSDVIEFSRFILRTEAIAFSAVSTWDSWGRWDISATAENHGATFKTVNATCQQGKGQPQRCYLEFTLLKADGANLYVEGLWSESGNEYKFAGELTKR